MPRQPLLVEGNDNLRAADIGFTSRDKVGLIRVFPIKKKKNRCVKQHNNKSLEETKLSIWEQMPFLSTKDQCEEKKEIDFC